MAVSTEAPTAPLPHSLDTAYLTISETAETLGVNPRTVRRWIKRENQEPGAGMPAEQRECPGGYEWAIPAEEVAKRLPKSSEIVPLEVARLDKALDSLESLSNLPDIVQDIVMGAVEGVVNPIVQQQEQQTEELHRIRELLTPPPGEPRPQAWHKRAWQWLRGGR